MFKQTVKMNEARSWRSGPHSGFSIEGAALSGRRLIGHLDLKVDSGTCRHLRHGGGS
jgi:hypothetical protein